MSNKLQSISGYYLNSDYNKVPVNKNYDIEKIKNNLYKIYINVVGFQKEEISIFIEEDGICVEAKSLYDYKKHNLLYKGIVSEFCNIFKLPLGFIIEDAYLDSGVLHIIISTTTKLNNNLLKIPVR